MYQQTGTPQLKIGDKVKLLLDIPFARFDLPKGSIGIIIGFVEYNDKEMEEIGFQIPVVDFDGDIYSFFDADSIEKVG